MRTGDDGSFAAHHTASATSGGRVTADDCPHPAKTLWAALHVVERYFGHAVALTTADNLEYQGLGWTNADSNQAYAKARVSTDQHPLCPVCEMDVDVPTAPKSIYRGRTYYFCMDDHKKLFDASRDRFVVA